MEVETAAAPVVEKTPLELALEGTIVIIKTIEIRDLCDNCMKGTDFNSEICRYG